MRIPPNIVDEIYRLMDIVEVIGDYVTLKRKGANYWALSPFVKEKTPSFAVNPVKGIYKCFSTGRGGNALNFIMEMEGMNYGEALVYMAKKYRLEIPEEQEPDEEYLIAKNKNDSLHIVTQYAADFFHHNLLQTPAGKSIGLPYFKERGILESTIQTFQLGYALNEWESLAKDAIAKQYREEFLVETGLCSKSEKTGNLIDRFRDRVMFPIANVMGKIVGFGGRILKKDDKEAKYINSPETEIYHKSKVLFGLYQAKNEIRNKDLCILTEGYMDVIALFQGGIKNVVASSGTALTEDQAKLIRRFTKNVMLIYDGDEAGIKAAMRGIDILVAEGMSVRTLILPDNHDPDSYIKAFGSSGFLEYLEKNATDFMAFKIKRLWKNEFLTPREKTDIIHQLAQTIAKIPEPIEQQLYLQETAMKLAVSEEMMQRALTEAKNESQKQEMREMRRNNVQPKAEVIEFKAFETLDLAAQEKELFRVLLNYHDKNIELPIEGQEEKVSVPIVEYFIVELTISETERMTFDNPYYEQITEHIFRVFREGQKFNINEYLNHPEPVMNNLVSELLAVEHTISENWLKHDAFAPALDANLALVIQDPMWYYKYKKINKLLKEVKQKMQQPSSEEEEDALFSQYYYLVQVRMSLEAQKDIVGATRAEDVG